MVVIQNVAKDLSLNTRHLADILQQVISDLKVGDSELLVRLVDENEIRQLNKTYRGKDKTTNVLSFPCDIPKEVGESILGDVVICVAVVKSEATSKNKTFKNHLLHIAVHGILHLLGFDHIDDNDAVKMEALEIKILQKLTKKSDKLLSVLSPKTHPQQ